MTSPHILHPAEEPLAASPALTTSSGDLLLSSLMAGRTYENIPRIKPARGRLMRPEPLAMPGGGSSITGTGGGSTGWRHGIDGGRGRRG